MSRQRYKCRVYDDLFVSVKKIVYKYFPNDLKQNIPIAIRKFTFPYLVGKIYFPPFPLNNALVSAFLSVLYMGKGRYNR